MYDVADESTTERLMPPSGILLPMPESCVRKNTGECQGPVVAGLFLQVKRENKNIGHTQRPPLCIAQAVKGGVHSWLAHTGEAVLWGLVNSSVPRTPRGLHLKYRVVVREPWRKLLRDLGF